MTSWSGGVNTGGWRVKNRSKFSALRPHYERGRKERMVGGETKQTDAVCAATPPSTPRRAGYFNAAMAEKKRCKTCMSFVSHQVMLLHEIAGDKQGLLAAPWQGIAGSNEMGVQLLAAFPCLHAVLHHLTLCHTHAVSLLKTVMVPGLTVHTSMLRPSSYTWHRKLSPCAAKMLLPAPA